MVSNDAPSPHLTESLLCAQPRRRGEKAASWRHFEEGRRLLHAGHDAGALQDEPLLWSKQ